MLEILTNLDLAALVNGASKILEGEVSKMTFAFLIAAYLHRGWVKKDMAEQFRLIASSLDNLADALSKRMNEFDERLRKLENDKQN
jgi:hypothetical protein